MDGIQEASRPFWTYIDSVLPRQQQTIEYNSNTQKGKKARGEE
jgi:hypothetical protein